MMYPLYYSVRRQLQKSHHRIHVFSLNRSLGNPRSFAAQQTVAQLRAHPTTPDQAGKKLPCVDGEGTVMWPARSCLSFQARSYTYLAQGTIHNKDSIQICCCPSSLFEKLLLRGICTTVSLSLTVLRTCVKCTGAASSSLSVIERMTTSHKDEARSSVLCTS